MKKFVLLISFLAFFAQVQAQIEVAEPDEIERFFKTKTYVVLDGTFMSAYDSYIEDAVKKYWKITEFETISKDQFVKKMSDPNASFLLKADLNYFKKDLVKARYKSLTLVLGTPGLNRIDELTQMPDLCTFPLSYSDDGEEGFLYQMSIAVRFMQDHVRLTQQKPNLNNLNIIQHYKHNVEKLNGKTLYVVKSDLDRDADSPSEIKKLYSNAVKILKTEEELAEIVESGDKNAVYLHKIGPGVKSKKARCIKLILGVEDAQLYYIDSHKINRRKPNGFLKSDWRSLRRSND